MTFAQESRISTIQLYHADSVIVNAHLFNISGKKGAVSDTNGCSQMPIQLFDTIQVSSIGLKPLSIIMDTLCATLDTIRLFLEKDTIHLQQINVNRAWLLAEKMKRGSWDYQTKEEVNAQENISNTVTRMRIALRKLPPPSTPYARTNKGRPPGINISPKALSYYLKKL